MSRNKLNINQAFRENAEKIVKGVKDASKDNIQALARFSNWNRIFVDQPIIPDTHIRHHFNNILRRHLIGSTTPQRFLFELSVFMIDLPELYLRLIDMFPIPYAIAGRLAFRAVVQHIEPSPENAQEDLARAIAENLPNPPDFVMQLLDKNCDKLETFEHFVEQLGNKLPKEVIEPIVRCFPPVPRMKYSIKYGCVTPDIRLDLSKISMPYEFIQAITDISGLEDASELVNE